MARKPSAHHGGAWKIAYADFVTALMALFLVLWISGQRPEIIEATSQYFRRPYKAETNTLGVLNSSATVVDTSARTHDPTARPTDGFLRAAVRDFYRLLNIPEDEKEKPVDVEITADGLRITLYDRTKKPLFEKETADLTKWGRFVVQTLAWLVERSDFRVFIDGHTAKGLPLLGPDYGPWELSADRANSTRRGLEFFAVTPRKIKRVTGLGDTAGLPDQPATSESNQRVTVSLSLQQEKPSVAATQAAAVSPTPPPGS